MIILNFIKKKTFYYLQASSTVAERLFDFPFGDHAWHSHLNGPLPKYSSTRSRVIVAVTSSTLTPVCGLTWVSFVVGGGSISPLHLKCNWKKKKKKEIHFLIYPIFYNLAETQLADSTI